MLHKVCYYESNFIEIMETLEKFYIYYLYNFFLHCQMYVRTSIYHGTESLCPPRDTKNVLSSNLKWNEWLVYELNLPDLPRSARLCLSLCSISRKQKRKVSWI